MHTIEIVNATGQYSFPFKPNSISAKAVIDETTSFFEFAGNINTQYAAEYNGKRYKYTDADKESCWRVILAQRVQYKAALMVARGEIIGINNAIKLLESQTK